MKDLHRDCCVERIDLTGELLYACQQAQRLVANVRRLEDIANSMEWRLSIGRCDYPFNVDRQLL